MTVVAEYVGAVHGYIVLLVVVAFVVHDKLVIKFASSADGCVIVNFVVVAVVEDVAVHGYLIVKFVIAVASFVQFYIVEYVVVVVVVVVVCCRW